MSGVSCAPIQDKEGLELTDFTATKCHLSKNPVPLPIREQCYQHQNKKESDPWPEQDDPGKSQFTDLQSMVAEGHALKKLQDDSEAVMLFKEINECSDESREYVNIRLVMCWNKPHLQLCSSHQSW